MSDRDTDIYFEVVIREGKRMFQLNIRSQAYTIRVDMSNADFQNFMRHVDNIMSDYIGEPNHGDTE